MDKRLIDADWLLECLKKEAEFCIKEKFYERNTRFYLGREKALTDIIGLIESGKFDYSDPIPLPTIKPGDTRQLLHNTINVMTDEQVQMVAKSLSLEVSHD